MPPTIRIITRESRLALWQTNAVTSRLEQQGSLCKVISVKSTGDIDLVKPIYEIGVQGVFTKELDSALLNSQADAAVHSLKDIPTVLAAGLTIAAVLERGSFEDILFVKSGFAPDSGQPATIATSSIRRKAQWLERFPDHTMVNVRGNVETRVNKFRESAWDGMILAKAGAERLNLDLTNSIGLPWMVPSPAQGAVAVVCRKEATDLIALFTSLHDPPTHQCVTVERDFLRHLHGGCSVPISAHARIEGDTLHFVGAVHSLDGTRSFRVAKQFEKPRWQEAGKRAAEEVESSESGSAILREIHHAKGGLGNASG
jgi:hydroxymethylbilane synthase